VKDYVMQAHYSVLVIDSGIGGMSIVKAIRELDRDISVTYISDDDFFPYGGMSEHKLINRLHSLVDQALQNFTPDAVIIACNTASTIALTHLRKSFSIPFVGVVPPIKTASEVSQSRVIGLLATEGTVRRNYIDNLINDFAPDCRVIRVGSRHLAAEAENKVRGRGVDRNNIRAALEPFATQDCSKLDVIVLGCTHYPHLHDELKEEFTSDVLWLDPALPVAQQLLHVLDTKTDRAANTSTQPKANIVYFTKKQPRQEDISPFLNDLGFSTVAHLSA
jgi:glutamate racemase